MKIKEKEKVLKVAREKRLAIPERKDKEQWVSGGSPRDQQRGTAHVLSAGVKDLLTTRSLTPEGNQKWKLETKFK